MIVEDDKDISNLIKYNLENEGLRCKVCFDGEDAVKSLNKEQTDLVLLDIMLPGIDGLEVARRIKQNKNKSEISIIMLTAKGEEVDKIVGFELGADDYIVKPFSPRELVLRVKAVLNRRKTPEKLEETLSSGKIEIDLPRHKITVDKKEIEFNNMEFKLLVTLMQRKGRVQTREKLLVDVWEISSDVTTRTVDTHIKRVRKKLGKLAKMVETVRGVGYRFTEK